MFLRMLLLGMVAGLGIEGPEGTDFDRLLADGRTWWQAQTVLAAADAATIDRQGITVTELVAGLPVRESQQIVVVEIDEVEIDEVAELLTPTVTDDAAFTRVVAAQIDGFVTVETPEPVAVVATTVPAIPELPELPAAPILAVAEVEPAAAPVAEVEPATGFGSTDLDVTEVLNLGAEGLGVAPPMVGEDRTWADLEPAAIDAPLAIEAETAPEPDDSTGPANPDRLGAAVRLTGEALHAWIHVFQHSTPEPAPRIASGAAAITE